MYRGIFERRSIPQSLDGGLHLLSAYALVGLQFGFAAGIGDIRPVHTGNLLQGLSDMLGTGGAGHTADS